MDLTNQQVVHKSFGTGSVIRYSDSYVEIKFPLGNKKFVFPDAFEKFLKLVDQQAASSVNKKIKKQKQKDLELKRIETLQREKQLHQLKRKRIVTRERGRRQHPSSQVVFWCKGQEKDSVFEDWSVFTGVVKSGDKEGQPKRLVRLNQNSACLLTEREPDMQEKDRRILGLYMVKEFFVGRLCQDGFIPAHPEYRVQLSREESERFPFWKYYVNERYPHKMTWNTGKYRYFDNLWLAQILRDVVSVKEGTEGHKSTERFFEYFCLMNGIKAETLPEPNGGLVRNNLLADQG